ncbi:FMN-dependent NADH-azoreductase [Polaribacter vadi]|uniref:FMN-dependent NADH-azoreductase n=1 Tax=Polaribacter vadi TaxID=1774273 RepID=UPI0030ED15F4|tara:strand:+ start:14686 stop:15267 length:582 start_codon:yes stop_codon:yes gene_type:complete
MKILNINSSSNNTASTSTSFAEKVVAKLVSENKGSSVISRRTTYSDLPFIDETMLGAYFAQERTEEQKEALKLSDELTNEVLNADVLVIGAPIYNFSVPASLKAYFDLIARAGLTFKYTEKGPVGLLENKKAYIVMASGGTEIGSETDFAGNYIKLFLGFLGVTDVEFVKLDQLMFGSEPVIEKANQKIATIS